MPLALQNLPGIIDLPSSALATGDISADWLLGKVHTNADFGLVAYEAFYGEYKHGDTVPLPISPVDGYIYSEDECFWIGALRLSSHPVTGRTSGGGNLHLFSQGIDENRKVITLVSYYVQGGAQTDTTDGRVGVWMFGVRNRALAAFASQPAWNFLNDSVFSQDNALSQTNLQRLSENAKFSTVRFEAFHDAAARISTIVRSNNTATVTFTRPHSFTTGKKLILAGVPQLTGRNTTNTFNGLTTAITVVNATTVSFTQAGPNQTAGGGFAYLADGFQNGDVVPLPISFVDGYAYSRSELTYFPFLIYTGKSDRSGPSGKGNIQRLQVSVDPNTGIVAPTITYWDGNTQTITNDGLVAVLVLAKRGMPAFTPSASAFVDLPAEAFFANAKLIDYNLKTLNSNIKFGTLRPEIFIGSYTNGQTVPLPTSPIDGYVYQRSELQYLFQLGDSGGATTDGLLYYNNFVDPTSGLVSSQVATYHPGGEQTNTNNGTLTVVTLARRSHQNVDAILTPTNAIGQLSGSLLDPIQLNADPSDPVITDVFINKAEGIIDWAWSGTAHSFDVQLDESGTATFNLNVIDLQNLPDRFLSLSEFALAHPFDFRVRPRRVSKVFNWFQIHYAGTTPGNVTSAQVSEAAAIIDGHREVALTFSWVEPPGDEDYSGIAIYVWGYQGVNLWVRHWAKSKGITQFVSTDLRKTGETVKFAFVSFDRGGFENPISTSPQVLNITLNGNDTAPNAPTGLTVTPQLGALLVTWTANIEPDLGGYEVWRDDTDLTSTPPTNFTKVSTLKGDLSGAGTVTYVDPVGSNISKRYSIRAYNTHGTLSLYSTAANGTSLFNVPDADDMIRNSRFHDWAHSTDLTALYWSIGQNSSATFKQTTSPPSGQVGQEIDISSGGSGTIISSKFPCRRRNWYVVGQEINITVTVTANRFRVYFYDQNGAGTAYIDIAPVGVPTGQGFLKNNIWMLSPQSGDTQVATSFGIITITNTLNYDPHFMAIETGVTAASATTVLQWGRVVGAEAKDVNNNVPLNAPATNNAIFTVTSTSISWSAFTIYLGGDMSNTLSISAGSITGLSPGSVYTLYYDTTPATAGVFQTQSLQSIQRSQFLTLGVAVTKLTTPAAPTLSSVALASAPAVTYFVQVQYQESGPNVSSDLSTESSLAVTAGNTVKVTSPGASTNAAYYAVWLGTAAGTETLVATTIPIGTNYTYLPVAVGGSGTPPQGPGPGSPPTTGGASGGGGTNNIGGGTAGGNFPARGGTRVQ